MGIRLIDARRSTDKSQSQVSEYFLFKNSFSLAFWLCKICSLLLEKNICNIRDGARVDKKISVAKLQS